MRFSLRSRRALVAAALAAPLLFLPAAGSAQEPGPYDGLPLITTGNDPATRNTYGWLGVAQVGRAYSPVSQQWGRVPVGLLATNIEFATTERTDENGDLIVDGDFDIHAYLQPTGGGGDQYGLSPEIVIRTVAFGSIPTEVRLQLRQRRDEADLPVGFYIRTRLTTNFTRQLQIYPPTGLEDLVDVAVVGLTVDDVPVPVEDSCATGPTARIELASEAVVIDQAAGEQFVQDRGFSGAEGGTLNGTLDIPAFAGCTTTDGDDLSAVLTSLVSGPDNPVTVKLGILGCYYAFDDQTYAPLPPQPDTAIADAGCAPDLRDGVEGVPSPLPLPPTAP